MLHTLYIYPLLLTLVGCIYWTTHKYVENNLWISQGMTFHQLLSYHISNLVKTFWSLSWLLFLADAPPEGPPLDPPMSIPHFVFTRYSLALPILIKISKKWMKVTGDWERIELHPKATSIKPKFHYIWLPEKKIYSNSTLRYAMSS